MKQKKTKNKIAVRFIIAGAICLLTICFIGQKSITEAQTVAEKRYKPELVIQTGHSNSVFSVAFSPDGKTLASGSFDNTIKLWSIESGQELKSLSGHILWVSSVAFSPKDKLLISGSRDATMKLWNKETGKLTATLTSLDKDDWVVTTPDGRFDTNEDLNKIEGLIWVLPDQPLTPKPGPMASRGLGQLAYDKGMKILSATQADNVALELGGSLKQGLLSYALLQDGIFNKLADISQPKNQLFIREWLKYGEQRVPALYEGIKNGTLKSVTIDNKPPTEIQRSGIYYLDKNKRQTLQQPKLFDFNEKRADSVLINLP